MEYLVLVLAILCLILALRLYSLDRNLRQGTKQLEQRRQAKSAAPLHLAAPHKASEELLSEVNSLLVSMEEERSDFRSREKALRQQIANVSHDLRTPLTSILGYLQLLEEGNLAPEERQEYMRVIGTRAQVLQGLITSFYDLSRLEAGEYAFTREKVDLNEVIGELLAAFYDELESHFAVSVALPEDLPSVWGDRAAITRVYTNLIRNALEHGAGTLAVSTEKRQGEVVTRFSNGGADLKPEDLPRVFDRFFTSDQTRSGRNTGLGLAIVKVLTEQMGGRATAELTGDNFSVILYWKT